MRDRPKDRLTQQDYDELMDIWNRGTEKQQRFMRLHERLNHDFDDDSYQTTNRGNRLSSVSKDSELGPWMRERFGLTEGQHGGQMALLYDPLPPHVDILGFKKKCFTKEEPSVTGYVVVDTDSTESMHTVMFDQTIKPQHWKHFKSLNLAWKLGYIEGERNTPIGKVDILPHMPEIMEGMGLSISEILETPKWQLFHWNSHQIHSGAGFESCKNSWKLHLTIQRSKKDYEKWINS